MKLIVLSIWVILFFVNPVKNNEDVFMDKIKYAIDNDISEVGLRYRRIDPHKDEVAYKYLKDYHFYEIDTFTTLILPRPESHRTFKIGMIDNNIYKLFGFSENEFNRMLSGNDVNIDSSDAVAYGKFYLDMTTFYDLNGHFYFCDARDLVELNQSLYDMYPPNKKTWNEVEEDINQLFIDNDLKYNVKMNRSDSGCSYVIDFLILSTDKGDIHKTRITVEDNGFCHINHDSTITTYFRYFH